MRRTRAMATTATLTLLLAVGTASQAAADTAPPSSPSVGAGPDEPDPELVQEAEDQAAEGRERLEAVEPTEVMAADATVDLRAADSTFDLDPADSTVTLEKKLRAQDDTVVTLTSDLLFDFGEATLTAEAATAVAELTAGIPQDATVHVDGHTDSIGTDADNRTLSEQRADAVADVLGDARPDLTLEVAGHGEEDPVADNEVAGEDNPAGRALNRRVEVTYPTS